MSTRDGKFTAKTERFLAEVAARTDAMAPRAVAARVTELVAEHETWRRRQCLNMTAAENVISLSARRLLDSDLATRVTEGFPGDKDYPPARQNRQIDEIEGIIIALARRLFGAEFVEWRAVNTSMANAAVYFALTEPGDVIVTQPTAWGGNYSYQPTAGPALARLAVRPMPGAGELFEVDLAALRTQVREVRPRMLVIGGSYVLFPYPVAEMRAIADEVGAILFYDASHLGLLVAGGVFQDPLAEGAHLMSMSSHKVMSGAVGGLVVTNERPLAEALLRLHFPSFIQTRDQNKYAATAFALAEMAEHGAAYARQMVVNAQALAAALEAEGFTALGRARGYSRTHQVVLDLAGQGGAGPFEERCQAANILVSSGRLVRDADGAPRSGARLTVQELTRQGMAEAEMAEVARFIRRAALDREPAASVAADVEAFLADYVAIRYSFDEAP